MYSFWTSKSQEACESQDPLQIILRLIYNINILSSGSQTCQRWSQHSQTAPGWEVQYISCETVYARGSGDTSEHIRIWYRTTRQIRAHAYLLACRYWKDFLDQDNGDCRGWRYQLTRSSCISHCPNFCYIARWSRIIKAFLRVYIDTQTWAN
jgi:hypothetical protein